MWVLCRKLQLLKISLKGWNRSIFGIVSQNVLLAEANLEKTQAQNLSTGMDEAFLKQELEVQDALNSALNMEEAFWMEKPRLKWHLGGDRNTVFFIEFLKFETPSNLSLF
ncbi:unnamed protein product [Lathyrus sativus]|nr:unnamed protein product [Lathyrus sativus]